VVPASIPFTLYGEDGPPLVFLHANGMPPACYRPLLSTLARGYRVFAMHLRPLWPGSDPQSVPDWRVITEDLLTFLDQRGFAGPVFCTGHSVGATATLRAALWQPERFARIALLDPVLFPPAFIRFFRLLRVLRLLHLIPQIRAASRRRARFDDLERLFQEYRRKPVFRYLSDRALRAYIQGILCPDGDGWRLCQSKEWEIQIYSAGIWRDMELWHGLSALRVPTRILRGVETDAFPLAAVRLIARKNPQIAVDTIQRATHLLPLEHPAEVARRLQEHFSYCRKSPKSSSGPISTSRSRFPCSTGPTTPSSSSSSISRAARG